MKRHLLIAIILCFSFKSNAQFANDFEAALYNISFSGVVSAIGAVINKENDQKTGNVLLKGFLQGSLGGYLIFESKRMVRKSSRNDNLNNIWPSKLVNSTGVSILENASANRDFWERWHINFGFNRFELDIKNNFKPSYRIIPHAFNKTIYGFIYGDFKINKSLTTGNFVFEYDDIPKPYKGSAGSNVVFIRPGNLNDNKIMAHEIIHVYQFESYSGFNMYFNKPFDRLKSNVKWTKFIFKIFYIDISKSLMDIHYHSFYKDRNSNFFEREAEYFSK